MIEWPIPGPSLPSNYSKMVRDSQDREEPGTLHGALDVMSACEIQQTVSCNIESRQLSQSREGHSVGAVVAKQGKSMITNRKKCNATRQLGDFLPEDGIRHSQSKRGAPCHRDVIPRGTAEAYSEMKYLEDALPETHVMPLSRRKIAVSQANESLAQQKHFVLLQRPSVSGDGILPLPPLTVTRPARDTEGILPMPEKTTAEDWQLAGAFGAGSQATPPPPLAGGSTLLPSPPSGGRRPRTRRDKTADYIIHPPTPLREPPPTAGPSAPAGRRQVPPEKQNQGRLLQTSTQENYAQGAPTKTSRGPLKMQSRLSARLSKSYAPQHLPPTYILHRPLHLDMGGLSGPLGERVTALVGQPTWRRGQGFQAPRLLGMADVGSKDRVTDRVFRQTTMSNWTQLVVAGTRGPQ